MEAISIGWMVGALVVLLVVSGFFSIAETSMMAINRYRLKHMAAQGHGGAKRVEELLKRTDRLLGAILIGNNVVNALIATVCGLISYQLFGQGRVGWAVTASTLAASFLIIVFAEITPKVIGATYPERLAPLLAYVLKPVLWLFTPGTWLVNLFVQPLLRMLGIRPGERGIT